MKLCNTDLLSMELIEKGVAFSGEVVHEYWQIVMKKYNAECGRVRHQHVLKNTTWKGIKKQRQRCYNMKH